MKEKNKRNLLPAVLCAMLFLSACGQEQITLEQVLAEQAGQNPTVQVQEKSSIWVHICGAVRYPGIYEMEAGSRIYDVIQAAGGFTEDADTGFHNLAQMVTDEMQVLIPTLEEAKEQGSLRTEITEQSGRININTASAQQLQKLPGIGESKALDIIAYREKYGGFEDVRQIMEVSGIKNAVFEKIEPLITVGK